MKNSNRTPAPVRRSQLRAEVTALTRQSLDRHGVDQQDIAAVTSARHQTVQTWCDDGQPATVPLADVVGIGHSYPEVALDHLRWAAAKLGYKLERVEAPASIDDAAQARIVVHEALDAIRAITETQADDKIEPHEAKAERVELEQLRDAIGPRIDRLIQIEHGVPIVGVRRAGVH